MPRFIYHGFGFSNDNIIETENWYGRRYSKLVKAQKENLAGREALGLLGAV